MGATKFIIGMRDAYFEELYKVFQEDKNAVFITADNGAPTLDKFASDFPDQYYQVGIAEQQMMGMAAGLAIEGRKVYTYAIAPFVTLRISEFIKLDQCAMNLPIVNIGIGAGYSYDIMGPTHHTVEDITSMRVFPNLKIYSPCDGITSQALVRPVHADSSPAYIRFDRASIPIYDDSELVNTFIGDGLTKTVNNNGKYAIITTGRFVHNSIKIVESLKQQGIDVDVIDIFRLKPVNTELLLNYVNQYEKVITYEEHFLAGGLGSIILEILNDNNLYKPTLRIGQDDKFVFDMGGREHIWKLYGLDPEFVTEKIKTWLKS